MNATVAAISTPRAPGGIGVIRISGDRALEAAEAVFAPASGKPLSGMRGYTCAYGHVRAADGRLLDEAVVTVFRAPESYTSEDVVGTVLRRMPDYVNYICPQFSRTHVNFQRVPTVDTSNPFIARWIPTPDESMVVIRFRNPRGIDFAYLVTMIHNSFMSRANSIVIPGNKLDLAMQLILTPMILKLVEKRRRAILQEPNR
jgi:hypothetical protein